MCLERRWSDLLKKIYGGAIRRFRHGRDDARSFSFAYAIKIGIVIEAEPSPCLRFVSTVQKVAIISGPIDPGSVSTYPNAELGDVQLLMFFHRSLERIVDWASFEAAIPRFGILPSSELSYRSSAKTRIDNNKSIIAQAKR
ncbi:hypothetical protein TSA1_05015 [Bradyrhizobium nitroreducens]|uniref:Uncharacterized protein n=1 Tax=Bradyrhizobium nitroreducens TaxID=709803 RepID=A0A2M6U6H0_9BRAD|nr:hypothetical protein TSA1_05015 [Bradyrhizobium nitroreducens]